MGYSISVALPTRAERDRMLAFLDTQDWERLADISAPDIAGGSLNGGPVAGADLAYPPDSVSPDRLLGFNGSGIPHAAWAVVGWVAAQYRKEGKHPHFYYDSERMTCVVDDDPTNTTRHFQVDQQGVFVIRPEKAVGFWGMADAFFKEMAGRGKQAKLAEQDWIRHMGQAWAQHNAPETPAKRPKP